MKLSGGLLIRKVPGPTSYGVVDALKRMLTFNLGLKKRDLPKIGHGGALDPFAEGLLVVLVGRGVKLAQYFLGSTKTYEGVMRFGETTAPGDPTGQVTETSAIMPAGLAELRKQAKLLTQQPYLQTPPMFSAKKLNGKPLYELARQGIEVEREPKVCHLYEFEIHDWTPPRASFSVTCSSGTYVRTLAQDFGRLNGSVALLESLTRTRCGQLSLTQSQTLEQIEASLNQGTAWENLACFVPFNNLLGGYRRIEATQSEAWALAQGQQEVFLNLLRRSSRDENIEVISDRVRPIYCAENLIGVATRSDEQAFWKLDRVFP